MRTYRTRQEALESLDKLRERGLLLVNKVQCVGGSLYAIPSSVTTEIYTVNLATEHCTCLSYKYLNELRERNTLPVRCKHLWAVILTKQTTRREIA